MSTEIIKSKPKAVVVAEKPKQRQILNMPRELIYGRQDVPQTLAKTESVTINPPAVQRTPTTQVPAVHEPFITVGSLRELLDKNAPGGSICVLPQFTSCALSALFQS